MNITIRLLLIENQPLTRLGVRSVVAEQPNIELAGEADNAADGFAKFRELKPDVTILGLRFPDSCSIDDLDNYFIENPKAKIIVLAEHAGDAEISKALKKGAAGYICKDIKPDDLVTAIRTVAAGRKYIPADIAQILSENLGRENLTATESNVLRMIVGGMSNKEIAFALDISENTVKSHVQNIFGKIGVSDRTSAATTAIRRGLVESRSMMFTEEIIDYTEKSTSEESDVLRELREHCYAHFEDKAMLSGFVQGRILSMFSKMIRPKVVLEIGTYLGYSALCFAEGLAEGGKVITLDIQEDTNKVARSYVERSAYKDNIEFHLGNAAEIIPTLPETFDLVFIDADKPNYSNYYRLVVDLIRPGGFIIADNVLWSGKVLDEEKDENTQALHDFNRMVQADERVTNILLPVRDGLMVVCKP